MSSTKRPRTSLRWPVRARLAATYAGVATTTGIAVLAVMYVVFVVLPSYDFAGGMSLRGNAPGTTFVDSVDHGASSLVLSSRDDVAWLLVRAGGVTVLLLAIAGAAVGWRLAGRMLRPLTHVRIAAERATHGALDHRIALAGPRDELRALADTVDEMLEALERSFASQARFAANASHELKTPLATTRAMLDVAIAADQPPDRELLARLRATNERSLDSVDAMLDLAQADRAERADCPLELGALASAVVIDLDEEIRAAGIQVEVFSGLAEVSGDPAMVRLLVTNLVLNAARHNRAGGWLRVTTRTWGSRRYLVVENSGGNITQSEVEGLIEPFRRGAGRVAAGRGLGLSIVAAIAHRHDATLELVARAAGGLRVTVGFPPVGDSL
jgi:two-component system sensor histidine kinase VanS